MVRCAVCNKYADWRCQSCRLANYCSKACQGLDWPIHKVACTTVWTADARHRTIEHVGRKSVGSLAGKRILRSDQAVLDKLRDLTELYDRGGWGGGDEGKEGNGWFVKTGDRCYRLWTESWVWECIEELVSEECRMDDDEAFDLAVKSAKNLEREWDAANPHHATGTWIYGADSKPYAVTWELVEVPCTRISIFAEENVISL